MASLERVFGLSINEEIQWGTAFADLEQGVLVDGYESGTLCPVPSGKLPHTSDDVFFLEDPLLQGLRALRKRRPDIFRESARIGVSSIGVIDRQNRLLVSIARKGWITTRTGPESHRHLVDFKNLFTGRAGATGFFPRITSLDQVIVQNDGAARCLAEYLYGFDESTRPASLLYLMAGEGVNGAVVFSGDFPSMIGHPELGHCMPQLHTYDRVFDPKHSGCPAHPACFEGLTTSARFRQQWGRELWELPLDHLGWDIASWYLAQMAMTGTLMLQPERIIFGGKLFYGSKGLTLINKIRAKFLEFNAGYLPNVDTASAVEKLIGRAAFGNKVWALSAVTMASSPGHAKRPEPAADQQRAESSLPVSPHLPIEQLARNADNIIQLDPFRVKKGI